MSMIQEIEDLKSEFAKKYANNPMAGVLVDGCYETKVKVTKTEQTALAEKQWEKIGAIYEEYKQLLEANGYKMSWNDYWKKNTLHKSDRDILPDWAMGSKKTKRFLQLYHNAYQPLEDAYYLLENACNRYAGQFKGLAKGDHGEEYVDQALELFHGKYKYAKNIKISHEDYKGNTSETDLYVMTNKGILVCEIKNKGNENCQFKISKDGQWTKYDRSGNFVEVMESPFAQNTRHCIATEMLLKANGVQDFKIIPVVIIANEKVRIDNDSDNSVIRISELYNFVEKLDYPDKYSEEYQQQIVNLLYANHIEEENYFDLNVVEEHMHKLTMDYARYYLQMIRDRDELLKEIDKREDALADQEIAKMKAKDRKKILRGFALVLIVEYVAWSIDLGLISIALGFLGIVGAVFFGSSFFEDYLSITKWEDIKRKLSLEGEF